MIVLGVDTSTARSSVAVLAVPDGPPAAAAAAARVLAHATHDGARGHGAFLAPAIAACLAEAGRDVAAVGGVGVGTGPGLYTGLRIGLATATAFAWARGLPVAGVPGPAAMVAAARRRPDLADVPLLAVLDARRGQWFHATAPRRSGPDAGVDTGPDAGAGREVVAPAVVGDAAGVAAALAAAGPDARAIGEAPDGVPVAAVLRPDAVDVARLAVAALRAGGDAASDLAPRYLREADVRIGWTARGGRTVGA